MELRHGNGNAKVTSQCRVRVGSKCAVHRQASVCDALTSASSHSNFVSCAQDGERVEHENECDLMRCDGVSVASSPRSHYHQS